MRLDKGQAQIVLGILGLNLGVLALAILLSTMPWILRAVLVLPAALGGILVVSTRIVERLQRQDRQRRALPASTPGLRQLLICSVVVFLFLLISIVPIVAASGLASFVGRDPLEMWSIGVIGLMICGGASIYLRLWEARLIDNASRLASTDE